jgi:hypothetical protein
MTKLEQLTRDIDTMRKSIRLQWRELASIPLSQADHNSARAAITSMVDELKFLLEERDRERPDA